MIVCGAAFGAPGSFPQPPAGSPVVPSPVVLVVLAVVTAPVLASPVSVPVIAPVASLVLPLLVEVVTGPPVCTVPVVGPPLSAVPSDIPLEPAGPVLSVVVVAADPSVQAASRLASNK